MSDCYKYIPDDEEVDNLIEDWLGNMRQKGTFVHKNTVDAMTRQLREDEAISEYVIGDVSHLDPVEFAKKARGIAQMTVDTMSPERIKVMIGGNTSSTDGKTVTVSSDFLDRKDLTPGEKADILIGYSAHEASHLIHTDFERGLKEHMKSSGTEQGIRKMIANIIEDERIEMKIGEDMPGIADYFAKVKKFSFDTLAKEAKASGNLPTEELPKFLNNLLAAVRYPAILERQDVIDNYDHLSRIKNVLTPFPKTTDEVYKATNGIIGVMKDLIKEELEEQKSQQSQGSASGQQEQQSQQGQSGQSKTDGTPGTPGTGGTQGQTEQLGQQNPERQSGQQPTQQEIEDAFNRALNSNQMKREMQAVEKEMQKSNSNGCDGKTCQAASGQGRYSDDDKDYINDDAELAVGGGAGGGGCAYIRKKKGNEYVYRNSYDRVKQFIPAVRKTLACKAQESQYALNGMPSGKMNSNKLVSVRTGNTNVFTRVGDVTTSGACVCILIDESGSMSGREETAARDAAVLINEAIKGIPNLEAFVYGFTTHELNVYCERKSTDRWGIGSTKSDRGTNTGGAMGFAADRIRRMTKSNCLMLVITDGVPDDVSKVQIQDNLLRRRGIYPIGVGISNSVRVTEIFKEAFAVDDLSELAPKLGRITKKYMDKLIVMNDSMAS